MMKPAFQTEYGKLYQGYCSDLFELIPDNSIDLIIADTPYGVTQNKNDKKLDLGLMWDNIKRVRKDNTPILLFAQGKYFAELVYSNIREYRYDLIWDKVLVSGFLNANRMPLRGHEQIAVFYKRLPVYNPQFSTGKPLHSKGRSYKSKQPINNNYGKFKQTDDKRAGSVLKYPKSILTFQKPHPSVALHRTEKPVELLEYLIKTYSNVGDTVLDFTSGSGPTLKAAENLKRKWIGFELQENEIQTTIKRFQQ